MQGPAFFCKSVVSCHCDLSGFFQQRDQLLKLGVQTLDVHGRHVVLPALTETKSPNLTAIENETSHSRQIHSWVFHGANRLRQTVRCFKLSMSMADMGLFAIALATRRPDLARTPGKYTLMGLSLCKQIHGFWAAAAIYPQQAAPPPKLHAALQNVLGQHAI